MSQEWSRVVSAEVKEEDDTSRYPNLLLTTHISKSKTVKSHLSLTLMRVKLVYKNRCFFIFPKRRSRLEGDQFHF